MMSGGKEPEFKMPSIFNRPEAFRPAPLSEKVENGNGVTFDALDVVEGDGLPTITDEYLSSAHRVVVITRDEMRKKMGIETAAATHYIFLENRTEDPNFEKDWKAVVVFYEPDDPPPAYALNPNSDELLKQVMGATKDVHFQSPLTGEVGKLKWGRSKDGEHLWAYKENLILENRCTHAGTTPITKFPESLTYEEKVRALYIVKQNGFQLCWKGNQLHLTVDTNVEQYAEAISQAFLASAFFAAPERQEKTEGIIRAFEDAIAPSKERQELGMDVTKAQLKATRNQDSLMPILIGGTLAGVLVGAAGVWVAYTTKKVVEQQAGGKIDLDKFIKTNTKDAFKEEYTKIVLDPELEAVLDELKAATRKRDLPHVCLVGASGSGKDLLAAHFEHLVARGKIPHLKDRPIYRVDATDVMAEGGVFFGKFDQVIRALRKKVHKEPSLARISEVHILCDTPQGGSPQITKALTLLEDPKGSIFIFTSSKWDEIKRLVPDVDRRLTPIQMPAMTFERVMNILRRTAEKTDGILDRTEGGKGIGITQLEDGVLEAIAHFSKLRTGEEAAIAPETLDLLSAKAANKTDERLEKIKDPEAKKEAKKALIVETNRITMKDVLDHARNDARKLGIEISNDQLRASLEFSRKFPDLEKPLFKTAIRLIALGEKPELVFEGDKAEEIIHRAQQRMIAEKLKGNGNGGAGRTGGPPPTAGGGEPPAGGAPPTTGGAGSSEPNADGAGKPSAGGPPSGPNSSQAGEAGSHLGAMRELYPGIMLPRDHTVEYWITNKAQLETEIGRPIGNDAIKFAAGAYVEFNDPNAVEHVKSILEMVDAALKEKGYPPTTKINATHISWGVTKHAFQSITDPFESAVKAQAMIEQGIATEADMLSRYPSESIEHVKAFADAMFSDFDGLSEAEKTAKLTRLVQVVDRGIKTISASKHAALMPNAAASINDLGSVQTALFHIGHDEHMTFRPEYLGGFTRTIEETPLPTPRTSKAGIETPESPRRGGVDPSDPPSAAGGSSEVGSGEGKSSRGGARGPTSVNRISVAPENVFERLVGPAMVGTMVGSTIAEHAGVINAGQKQAIDLGMLGGMTAAHPALLWELPVAGPLMAAGHEATQAGLEKVGVGRETLTSKLSGLGGAFAFAEGAAYATGRMAGETGPRALATGHQIFQNAIRQELPARLNELKTAVTSVATQARAAIPQITQTARQVGATAAAGGAALMVGGVTALKTAAASAATAVVSSATATAGVTVAAGLAVGAGIHYSGLGKWLGLNWLGEKTGDAVYALRNKIAGEEELPMMAIAERNKNSKTSIV